VSQVQTSKPIKNAHSSTGDLSVSLGEQYLQMGSKQSSSKRSLHVMHYSSLLHHRQQHLQQKQLQQQAEEEHQLELHDLHAYDCIMQLNMQQKLELLLHVHECASPQIQVCIFFSKLKISTFNSNHKSV